MEGKGRLVVGMTGSSAPHLGAALLRIVKGIPSLETHLVMTAAARTTISIEMGTDPAEIEALADVVYDSGDFTAAISSGSFLTIGMVVIPCSVRTLAGIASGNATDLLLRSADVCLKERRKLVLVVR